MNIQARTTVTSAEFTRHFGHLRQTLGSEPVFITHHGRETHVLLTAARYHDLLSAGGQAQGVPAGALPRVDEFADWVPHGAVTLDGDLRVVLANGAAQAMLKRSADQLVGQVIFDAVPQLMGSLYQLYVARAIKSRERICADLPSVMRKNGWTRLEVIPSMHSTTILFHDITDDVRAHRLADAKKAMVEAVAMHGGIGSMRVNARGQVEQADPAMCAMLALTEQRLSGALAADLVPIARRVAFREQLDHVLRGDGSVRVETEMLSNDGNLIAIRGAITELRGAYGAEGAVLAVTRA